MTQTFAQKVESAAQLAHSNASPVMASKAEICDSIQVVINELWEMPYQLAVAYICDSYSHNGHQALAVRMFKNQPV